MNASSPSTPGAQEARDLLVQASGVEATARAGASWPAIAYLFMLGPASALSLIGFHAARQDVLISSLVLGIQMFWIVAGILFLTRFQRVTKRGFGTRWLVTMALWAVLWAVGMVGVHSFGGGFGFVAGMAVALSAVCFVGAWVEAAR